MIDEALVEAAPPTAEPVVEAPVVEQAPVVEAPVVEPTGPGRFPFFPSAMPEAPVVEPMPSTAPDGSQLLHQRGPGRTRRGILCMPATHNNPPPGVAQLDWNKGGEPWFGTVSPNVGLVNCPACLAVRDGRAGGDGAAGAAGPTVEAERPKAEETAKPAIMASQDDLAELAASIVVGGLYLISQAEARVVKADPELVKQVTGLTSPFFAPLEGTTAYPAFKNWERYLRKLIAQAGGAVPEWVLCMVASVPVLVSVAMLKGTRQEVTA